jgi:hypothetical protein
MERGTGGKSKIKTDFTDKTRLIRLDPFNPPFPRSIAFDFSV